MGYLRQGVQQQGGINRGYLKGWGINTPYIQHHYYPTGAVGIGGKPISTNSSRGTQWEQLRQQVLQRDAYMCVYCGNEANEADHVIAKANGGKDELTNLVSACRRCNGSKQDRTNIRLNYFNRRWLEKI